MKKSTKIIWAIVGVGALATAGFFLIRAFRRKRRILPPPTPTNGTTPSPSPTGAYSSDAFPLKQGSGGDRVKALQRWLNVTRNTKAVSHAWGFYGCDPKLVVDGKWGNKTQECYKKSRKVPTDTATKEFYDKAIKPNYES